MKRKCPSCISEIYDCGDYDVIYQRNFNVFYFAKPKIDRVITHNKINKLSQLEVIDLNVDTIKFILFFISKFMLKYY